MCVGGGWGGGLSLGCTFSLAKQNYLFSDLVSKFNRHANQPVSVTNI